MRRSIFLMCLLLLAAGSIGKAQLMKTGIGGGVGKSLTDHMLIKLSDQYLKGLPEEEVEGSPYLKEEFEKADVYTRTGAFGGIEMRYNIYGDYFEFREKGQLYALDPRNDLQRVNFEDEEFIVDKYASKGRMVPAFFQRLDSGKVSLLVKQGVMYTEGRPPQALESEARPARYTRTHDDYYIKLEGQDPVKVSNLKTLIHALPDRHSEMQQYAKKEKISAKDSEELLQFVRHYNSLHLHDK